MRNSWRQKLLSGVLAAAMAVSAFPGSMSVFAAENTAGTPYDANGYNVTVPHVIVNQVYG